MPIEVRSPRLDDDEMTRYCYNISPSDVKIALRAILMYSNEITLDTSINVKISSV